MADNLTPPAPQQGGDGQRANDDTAIKGNGGAKEQVGPAQINAFEKPEASWLTIIGMCVDVSGILFLWACLLDDHNISSLVVYFAALLVAYVPVCYCLFKFVNRFKWVSSVCCFIALNILTAVAVYNNSRPTPDAKLLFGLQVDEDPSTEVVWDGKEVSIPSNVLAYRLKPDSCLVIPRRIRQTNVVINFILHNTSALDVDSITVYVKVPKDLRCLFSPSWHKADINTLFVASNISSPTNDAHVEETLAFAFQVPGALLRGDSIVLPGITNIALPAEHKWDLVCAMVKSKESMTSLYPFNITFVAFPTNTLPKPFYSKILKTSDGTKEWIKLPDGWTEPKE